MRLNFRFHFVVPSAGSSRRSAQIEPGLGSWPEVFAHTGSPLIAKADRGGDYAGSSAWSATSSKAAMNRRIPKRCRAS
jgi:hypothetical protein